MSRIRPVSAVAITTAAALAGCGSHKIARTHTPAKVGGTGTSSGSTSTTGPASSVTGHFVGDDIPTQFGDIQVEVTLDHGRITDVQWLKLPYDRPRSQFISQQAAPILRTEVLTAQSAKIDLLSGATYTSDAWATSVQSALSRAR